MELPRILLYVVVRVIAALVAGLGLALDFAGESFSTISSSNWGLIGLIAFGVFILITFVREIDLALQQKPKIKVKPVVYNNRAILEVNNSGGSGNFRARARVIATNPQAEPYVMYWEGQGDSCVIDNGGLASILVAEKAKTSELLNRDADTAIYEGGLVGFKIGTSGEQIFPIRTYEETVEKEKVIGRLKDKGEVEITITANPSLAKPFSQRCYILDFDDRRNLSFSELSTPS